MTEFKELRKKGEIVSLERYGRGTIVQVDSASADFRYLVSFDNGSLKWCPVWENLKPAW